MDGLYLASNLQGLNSSRALSYHLYNSILICPDYFNVIIITAMTSFRVHIKIAFSRSEVILRVW